jgi:lipid-A-disaccharide synthase
MHGARLARALRRRIPGVRLIGLGGPHMAAEGVELLAGVDDLAVMGFVEVLGRLPFFFRLRRRVFEALARERVDLVVPVDYPGFNLRLARHARERGIRVLYYIAPQVWAWHASRARALATDADLVAVILPFEQEFLAGAGANARFVGHPLLDAAPPPGDRAAWCAREGLEPDRPVLALFPGSRSQEVERHLALLSATAREVVRLRPEVQPVVVASGSVAPERYAAAAWPLVGSPQEALRYGTAAIVKSGTTTLEAALAGIPFLVVYRMNPLTYQLARRLVRVPHIALANLIAGERVVPEFVQHEATVESLTAAVMPLLDEGSERRRQVVAGLGRVRAALGEAGAAERVAGAAAELLGR